MNNLTGLTEKNSFDSQRDPSLYSNQRDSLCQTQVKRIGCRTNNSKFELEYRLQRLHSLSYLQSDKYFTSFAHQLAGWNWS